ATENDVDVFFINRLLSVDKIGIASIKKDLESIDFEYKIFLNEIPNLNDIQLDLNLVISEIVSLREDVDIEKIEPYFIEYFAKYFENNFHSLDSITTKDIYQKENSLKYKYSIYQNSVLASKR